MNPSYNNGVGSQVPQSNLGQQPTIPQQPMQSQQPIISSGTGDVVLSGDGSEKKSRKGVVILIVLVILTALVGGGFLLWQNGAFGGGTNNSSSNQQANNLQTAYNSYVNYALWGVESDGRPDLAKIEEVVPYFENLQDAALDGYVTTVNQKYNSLKQLYDVTTIENKVDVAVLKSYFEEYPKMKPLSTGEIVTVYLEEGENASKRLINEKYAVTENTEKWLKGYLDAAKSLAEMKLDLIKMTSNTDGCIQDNELLLSCSGISDEQRTQISEKIMNMASSRREMHDAAYDVLKKLASGLYGE